MQTTYTTPAGSAPALCADILKQPHVMIAGATNSGKSVLLNSVIYTALYSAPSDIGLVLIDPKRVELVQYNRLPHAMAYASEPRDIITALAASVCLMENRYEIMQRERAKRWTGREVYIIIDELADLITTSKREVVPQLCRLAQLGRAAGIHLIVATQRPTRDIVNGQIKVNIDARVALRCPTRQDSRNIINDPGAEALPRYGRGLYLTPDTMHPVLVDIPITPDEELQRLVDWWTPARTISTPRPRSGILARFLA